VATRNFRLDQRAIDTLLWIEYVLSAPVADGGFGAAGFAKSPSTIVRVAISNLAATLDGLISKKGDRGTLLRSGMTGKLRAASKGESLPFSTNELLRRARATSAVQPVSTLLAERRAEQPRVIDRIRAELARGKTKPERDAPRMTARRERLGVAIGEHQGAAALRALFTHDDDDGRTDAADTDDA